MIGIFDSGVGGLTVAKEMRRQLPDCPLIYFGDTARTPYGNKSQAVIERYSAENTDFLLKQGATAIVIGCNTASALAADYLKKKYPGTPIFEVISPAVRQAVALTKNKKIGIIGTRGTIGSGIYAKKIKELDPAIEVFSVACPLLVALAEENYLDRPETKMIVRRYLSGLRSKGIDTLILGCTHYPLLKDIISAKIGKRVRLVDSAEEVVKELKVESYKVIKSAEKNKFYFSDLTPQVREITKRWLGGEVELVEVPSEN
ncbi:MAG: glutamate racemase [Patescibacteria group bacterium]|jgi:glutamate racemase